MYWVNNADSMFVVGSNQLIIMGKIDDLNSVTKSLEIFS